MKTLCEITEDNPMLWSGFELASKKNPLIAHLRRDGWVMIPDWMPVGISGYNWMVVDGIQAMMRPRPTQKDKNKYRKVTA